MKQQRPKKIMRKARRRPPPKKRVVGGRRGSVKGKAVQRAKPKGKEAKSPRKSTDKEPTRINKSKKAPVKETYQQYLAKLRNDRRRIEKLVHEYYRDDSRKRMLESAKRIRDFEKKSGKR